VVALDGLVRDERVMGAIGKEAVPATARPSKGKKSSGEVMRIEKGDYMGVI
jgi:hypothetical protein